MKCKVCGNEIPNGAKFCTVCGSITKPISQTSSVFTAIGKMICYVFLFFGVQSLVLGIYMSASIMPKILDKVMAGGDAPTASDILNMFGTTSDNGMHYAMILSSLITILILSVFYSLRKKIFIGEIELNHIPIVSIPLIAVGAVAFQFFIAFTMSMLPIPSDVLQSFEEAGKVLLGGTFIVQFLNIAIFTPITEELIFRGMIFTRFRKAMPAWVAVLLSSMIFGVFHGHVISFAYATILGIVMALLMINFKSIVAPLIFHICFNGASFINLGENQTTYTIVYIASIIILAAITATLLCLKNTKPNCTGEEEDM